MKENGVLGYAIAPMQVRLVVHLDVSADEVQKTIELFNHL
jgi:threonine aldolase